MKITIIIPSLNEAENISFVTKTIDSGLKIFSKNYNFKAIIFNADSGSNDKTVENFLKTKTLFPKKSVSYTGKSKGKGKNIYEAIKSTIDDTDYYATFDSDLRSIKASWIKKMFIPIITKKSDLSVPIYNRNRYEGNTTNHFSAPIIYALFGQYIAQPIAGDFAFSSSLAKTVLNSISSPSDLAYGIDSHITWAALLNNLNISQIKLGKKIHNPSFSKIVPMFHQVATSTLLLIGKNREKILSLIKNNQPSSFTVQNIDQNFISKPRLEQIKSVNNTAQSLSIIREPLSVSEWTQILSSITIFVLNNKLSSSELNKIIEFLLSAYLLRVVGYFNEIESISPRGINRILKKEILMLRKNVEIVI